ncbi:hypothetical protein [Paenibacillus paeoniae]|uniref:Uncharacterized protein n=1 Tax=Paenibacillus paeoniae TaxID=2292705 RepID=A0A371P5T1_9BACL|nr:hypothetical protein [Paenibacillus paeoniae]REK71249.1 hypothetical protein DX130_22665 [Paenibacillus paeoniae]
MAVFDGYTYLHSSTADLTISTNLTATVSATTHARTAVAEVGASIQLQEWNGSSWINLVPVSAYSSKNTNWSFGGMNKSVRSGYYYRAKVTHFVKHNGITESAIEYSETIMAQ